MTIDSGMNVYQGCQAERQDMPKLDPIMRRRAMTDIEEWAKSGYRTHYFMLLCNEMRYYTTFCCDTKHSNIQRFAIEVGECIDYCGELLEVEVEDDTSCEIWIRSNADGQPHMYKLFKADDFVIEVK